LAFGKTDVVAASGRHSLPRSKNGRFWSDADVGRQARSANRVENDRTYMTGVGEDDTGKNWTWFAHKK
jgi:hypothetical protein